jgi:hypothetical protein
MSSFKANIKINLDLTPPQAGEGRDVLLRRCIEGAGDIMFLLAAHSELPNRADTRDEILAFFRGMKRFFEPNLPPRFEQALREWEQRYGDPGRLTRA